MAMSEQKQKKQLSYAAMILFFYELSLLFRAGISAEEGIRLMRENGSDGEQRESQMRELNLCLAHMEESLSAGRPLSAVMRETAQFPEYACKMIAAGELTGNLDQVAEELWCWYTEQRRVREEIKRAALYPSVLFLLMSGILLLISAYVLPVFEEVLDRMGIQLTGFSGAAFSYGRWTGAHAPLIVGVLALIVLTAVLFRRRIGERLPAQRNYARARFASAMAMGMACGLDSTESCEMACGLSGNAEVAQQAKKCQELLAGGSELVGAAEKSGVFSPAYCRLLAIGMRTGEGDAAMRGISERLSESAARDMTRLVAVIEPTIVILMCLMAGMMLLSVMLPLLSAMAALL